VFAFVYQFGKNRFHARQVGNFRPYAFQAGVGKLPNPAPVGAVVQLQKSRYVVQRKSKVLRALDEADAFHRLDRVMAKGIAHRRRGRQQFQALVIADGFDSDMRCFRQPSDGQVGIELFVSLQIVGIHLDRSWSSFARRKRSALLMTDTELRLIAALAIIGLNNMPSHG